MASTFVFVLFNQLTEKLIVGSEASASLKSGEAKASLPG